MPLNPLQTSSNTTPPLGGDSYYSAQNSDVAQMVIEELVTIDQSTQAGKSYVLLSQTLPPSASVRWYELQDVTDVAVTGNDATITANGIGLFALTVSVPAATGTTSGSAFTLGYITSTASGSRRRSKPEAYTQGLNTNTVPVYLFLAPAVPTNTSTNAGLNVGATGTQTLTAGYKFGTSTATNSSTNQLRLRLFVDVYRNMPS